MSYLRSITTPYRATTLTTIISATLSATLLIAGVLLVSMTAFAQGVDVVINSLSSTCGAVTFEFTVNSNPTNENLTSVIINTATGDVVGFVDVPDSGTHTITAAITAQPNGSLLLVDVGSGLATFANRSRVCGVIYPPSDGRVNPGYGDLEAVGYTAFDDDGNPSLVVYCWTGEADLSFVIQADDLPQSGIPAQNVLVKQAGQCRAAFYALASGEYQFMVWFDEGKVYTLIDDDLDFRDAHKTYYDPNE